MFVDVNHLYGESDYVRKEKKVLTTFNCTVSVKRRLDMHKINTGISNTALIQRLLEEYLDDYEARTRTKKA